MWLSGLYFCIWCRSLFWFAIACILFLALLLLGIGIGWLFLFCFLALAAIVFGWLGCLYCFAILGVYLASYWVFCFVGSGLLDEGRKGDILVLIRGIREGIA